MEKHDWLFLIIALLIALMTYAKGYVMGVESAEEDCYLLNKAYCEFIYEGTQAKKAEGGS